MIPLDGPQIPENWFNVDSFQGKENPKHKLKWLPLEENRTVQGQPWINHDGEYTVRVDFAVKGSPEATNQSGALKVGVDGNVIGSRRIGWDNAKRLTFQAKTKLKKGRNHTFFVSMEPGDPPDKGENKIAVQVQNIRILGPLDGSVKEYPYQFRYIFSDGPPPDSVEERDKYRETILRNLATRKRFGDRWIRELWTAWSSWPGMSMSNRENALSMALLTQ